MQRGVPLLADLLRVYGEKGLVAISFTAYNPELDGFIREHMLKHSIALTPVDDKAIPYVDVPRNGFTYIFVIGRNGKVRWRGDYVAKEEEFLKALWKALNTPAVPPLEQSLDPALNAAVSKYCDGALADARKMALNIGAKYSRKNDGLSKRIVEHADYLIKQIDAHAEVLLHRMMDARANGQGIPFATALGIFEEGYAKTDVLVRAKELEKDAGMDMEFSRELKAAEAWLDLLKKYPLLFPIEKSRLSAAYAAQLRKFMKKHEGLTAGKTAEKLLSTYSS